MSLYSYIKGSSAVVAGIGGGLGTVIAVQFFRLAQAWTFEQLFYNFAIGAVAGGVSAWLLLQVLKVTKRGG